MSNNSSLRVDSYTPSPQTDPQTRAQSLPPSGAGETPCLQGVSHVVRRQRRDAYLRSGEVGDLLPRVGERNTPLSVALNTLRPAETVPASCGVPSSCSPEGDLRLKSRASALHSGKDPSSGSKCNSSRAQAPAHAPHLAPSWPISRVSITCGGVTGLYIKGQGSVYKPLCWVLAAAKSCDFPAGAPPGAHSTGGAQSLTSSGTRGALPCHGASATAGREEPSSSPWSLWPRLVFQSLKPTPPPLPFPPSGAPRGHPTSSSGPGGAEGNSSVPPGGRAGRLAP